MAGMMRFAAAVRMRLIASIVSVFVLLAIVGLIGSYYVKFGQYFGRHLGRIAATKGVRHLVPFAPLFVLTLPGYVASTPNQPRVVAIALRFLIGLVLVELYSVGLYLRSM